MCSKYIHPGVNRPVSRRMLHGCRVLGLSVHSRRGAHSWAYLGWHVAHVRRHVWSHAGAHIGAIRTCPHLIWRNPSWRHTSIWRTSTLSCHGVHGAHPWSRVVGVGHVAIGRLAGITYRLYHSTQTIDISCKFRMVMTRKNINYCNIN